MRLAPLKRSLRPSEETQSFGFSPKTLQFNGSGEVAIAGVPTTQATGVTLEGWLYLPSTSAKGALVTVGTGTHGYSLGVGGTQTDNLGNDLIGRYEGIRWIDTNVAIGTGWHHLAMTIAANGTATFYRDGVEVATSAGTAPGAPSGNSNIGGSGTRMLSSGCRVADVRVWNVVRTAAEIADNRSIELTGEEAGLVGYWKLDEAPEATDSLGVLPSQLSGLQLWLASDAITGLSDGAAIATWPDRSTFARNATQATEAKRATYETNELNGQPAVRYDATKWFLLSSPITGLTDFTVFSVIKRNAGAPDRMLMGDNDSVNYLGDFQGGLIHFHRGGVSASTTATSYTDGLWSIYAFVRTGSTLQVYRNGAQIGANIAWTANAIDVGEIGSRLGGLDPWSGDMAQVVIYNRALVTWEHQRLEDYLRGWSGLVSIRDYTTGHRNGTPSGTSWVTEEFATLS